MHEQTLNTNKAKVFYFHVSENTSKACKIELHVSAA